MSTVLESTIASRGELPVSDTWNLESIYPNAEAWEAAFKRLDELAEPVIRMKGTLNNPTAVAAVFKAQDELHQLLDRLYTYAHLREDEDTTNSENQARQQRIAQKLAEIMGQTAWVSPEILSQDLATLEEWRDSAPLAAYRRTMRELIRQKPHTLSDAEETLLSRASEVFRAPYTTFGYLTNADMKFPGVEDENGQKQQLSNGRYIRFMENRNRAVRKQAFEKFYDTYIGFENTLAATLATNIKAHNFNAQIRHFGSALEASLHPDNIPVALYDSLIKATHTALPAFHEYLDLRREVLSIPDLNAWDLHVPIVPDYDLKVDWKQAREWVTESLRPMGSHYAGGVADCFTQRWIDIHENKGKRSGAYSGGCYGTYPFILMNYQGTLDHVFTLAHEMGHSLHSWLANSSQPYRYADYTIFVAEIASTTNEALLHHYLLENASDPRFKAYLLNHLCDAYKGTVYRQVMFAEFERMVHEMDQNGEPLTARAISDAYYRLNAEFHGDGFKADERISHEWSRIPHFYYNFYVYKYATGFCAAQVFAKRILQDEGLRDQYLDMLRAGGSADPLELVKNAGVDLTDPAVLTTAFASFQDSVRQLRGLLV